MVSADRPVSEPTPTWGGTDEAGRDDAGPALAAQPHAVTAIKPQHHRLIVRSVMTSLALDAATRIFRRQRRAVPDRA